MAANRVPLIKLDCYYLLTAISAPRSAIDLSRCVPASEPIAEACPSLVRPATCSNRCGIYEHLAEAFKRIVVAHRSNPAYGSERMPVVPIYSG